MSIASKTRSWLPVLPLLGILAMTYWLDQHTLPQPAQPDDSKLHIADAIVDDVHAVTLNKQGTPNFIMSAKQLIHYGDDDTTTLEAPDLTAFTPDQPNIHMTSKTGKIVGKGQIIELNDDVKVVRAASKKQAELDIQTDYLKVEPNRELASTNRPVTLTEANDRLTAIGMNMDNHAQIIRLLSNVKAVNVPK